MKKQVYESLLEQLEKFSIIFPKDEFHKKYIYSGIDYSELS